MSSARRPSSPMHSARDEATSAEGEPRYRQVAAELRQAIADGSVPVGAHLPTELELCERHGISRFTAREAVRMLVSAGLVTRRPRIGTVVVATPDEARYRHDVSSMRDLLQYAADTELRLLYVGKVALGREQALAFGTHAGDEWTYVVGLRIEGKAKSRSSKPGAARRPIGVTRIFLNPSLTGIEERLRKRNGAVYALIEQDYRIEIRRIEQELQGVVLDVEDAGNLGATAGEPALRIVRKYYAADDRLLEVAENVHPSDRFTYRMEMRR